MPGLLKSVFYGRVDAAVGHFDTEITKLVIPGGSQVVDDAIV